MSTNTPKGPEGQMPSQGGSSGMTRRGFLTALGVTFGAAAIGACMPGEKCEPGDGTGGVDTGYDTGGEGCEGGSEGCEGGSEGCEGGSEGCEGGSEGCEGGSEGCEGCEAMEDTGFVDTGM